MAAIGGPAQPEPIAWRLCLAFGLTVANPGPTFAVAKEAPMMDPLEHIRMLKDSAAGIAPRKGDLKRIRALRFTEPGFDRATWRRCVTWAGSACA